MGILKFLMGSRPESCSANQAKERLQLIIAHESTGKAPDFLPKLLEEIKQVISRYMEVTEDRVNLNFQRKGNTDVLEMNLILDDKDKEAVKP